MTWCGGCGHSREKHDGVAGECHTYACVCRAYRDPDA